MADEETIIVKEAVIRGEDVRKCPFRLPIPEACENAGDSVERMAPIDENEEDDSLGKANRLVYAYSKKCKQCPYADKILEKHKKVDCDFGDTASGRRVPSFKGSPLYPQTFQGIGLDGLYGYPLGFYADNNESRNLFFGLFSFLGSTSVEELIKLAEKYDDCDEEEKADIVDGLLKKLQNIREEYGEVFDRLVDHIKEYRDKYEEDRHDTGLLYDLSQKWFGPRQVSR